MLNYNAIQTKTFNYTTNLNVSWAKTQIDSWLNDEFKREDRDVYDLPSPGNPGRAQILGEGMEIGTFRGGRYAGVNENEMALASRKVRQFQKLSVQAEFG